MGVDSAPFSDIRYEVAEGIAKLTICRPERRNAFRPADALRANRAFTLAWLGTIRTWV